MRSLGVITLLSVIATAAAPARQQPAQMPAVTAKDSNASLDCFGKSQDPQAAKGLASGSPAMQGADQCM